MAIKITTSDLEELKALAEEYLEKAESAEAVADKDEFNKDLEAILKEYKAISKAKACKAAEESGDALRYAVLNTYPVIRVKETTDKETNTKMRSIVSVNASIDLGYLHKRITGGIGADKMWIHKAELLNYYLTIRACQRLNDDSKLKKLLKSRNSFNMTETSKAIDMGKTPCSNTNLLKTLQSVITAMIGGDYKATSHDVNYLVDVYSNDSKKSKTSITCANHKTLRNYLSKVCYRILLNRKGYDVEQKEYIESKESESPEAKTPEAASAKTKAPKAKPAKVEVPAEATAE